MRNKTLAFWGIGIHILSVISSAEDLKGGSRMPELLIFLSGTLTILFVIFSCVRLWNKSKKLSIAFLSSTIFLAAILLVQEIILPGYGTFFTILGNILTVINFVLKALVIIKLFKLKEAILETRSR